MHTLSFRAMGSPCRLVADGCDETALAEARELIDDLERRWSRFLPESEISDLNRTPGDLTIVSEWTYRLVEAAAEAQVRTGGLFHPLMLDQLIELGYHSPWQEAPATSGSVAAAPATHQPIELFAPIRAVRLPPGTRLDPGGIGKGLAADLATEFLVGRGATTSSVELGGDLRVTGQAWYGPSWRIGVADPFDDEREIAGLTIESGAVVTSSIARRRWTVGGETVHHLLDPRTGLPSTTDLVAVSMCGATAAWTEVAAKAALLSGSEHVLDVADRLGIRGIAVTDRGAIISNSPDTKSRIPEGISR